MTSHQGPNTCPCCAGTVQRGHGGKAFCSCGYRQELPRVKKMRKIKGGGTVWNVPEFLRSPSSRKARKLAQKHKQELKRIKYREKKKIAKIRKSKKKSEK